MIRTSGVIGKNVVLSCETKNKIMEFCIVEFAAKVHQKFVFIHPFVDGNGRLARLIMNLALLRGEYTIAIIPAIRRMEYVIALEIAHKDKAPFVEFIADCVVSTQEDLLRLLKKIVAV